MSRTGLNCALIIGLLIAGHRAAASDLVPGSDPKSKPIKEALAVLVKQVDAGDFEKAKAAYAGENADLDLLKAYVDGVAATKAMRSAMTAKFGEHFSDSPAGLDLEVKRMAVKDFNSVIFQDDPNRASSSADSPMGVGIEFKRVGGEWKVLSLASSPGKPEQHLARLKKYIAAVNDIAAKVKSGAISKEDDAAVAAEKAEGLLWPELHGPVPATGPGR